MSMPSQIMDSLLLPAVTNARASPDNTPTNENRWLIGYVVLSGDPRFPRTSG